MTGRCFFFLLLFASLGCGEGPPSATMPDQGVVVTRETGTRFDPDTAGTISGMVAWEGLPPAVPPLRSIPHPLHEATSAEQLDWPNPNAPLPGASPRAVRGAVVFLRGVSPEQGRAWDLPPVHVDVGDRSLIVVQGQHQGRTGVVRAGARVEIASRSDHFHLLQGRGQAFFSLPLPGTGAVGSRVLDRTGLVELRSGTGYFWLRAYLFVDHHPYFTHSDEHGRFTLDGVPPGRYQVVAWHPDWRVASRDRHQDFQQVSQVHYHPAREAAQSVSVAPRGRASVSLSLRPD